MQRRQGVPPQPLPIKIGFIACSFNSKAVLYLSHDMFRFFDPEVVEVHIFSTGSPDSPTFIQKVMRGVDWRQRVIDTVDYFHDVRRYKNDHVGLARYIREEWEMEILIDWDGYARQVRTGFLSVHTKHCYLGPKIQLHVSYPVMCADHRCAPIFHMWSLIPGRARTGVNGTPAGSNTDTPPGVPNDVRSAVL